MKYYYKLSEASRRDELMDAGYTPNDIHLYRETETIKNSFDNDDNSDWWPVHKFDDFSWNAGDFRDVNEAAEEYYANEAHSRYERIHDL